MLAVFAFDARSFREKCTSVQESATFSIGGNVTGNVTASERVDLLAGGRLIGDVKAARLTIADGASFKGNVDMDV